MRTPPAPPAAAPRPPRPGRGARARAAALALAGFAIAAGPGAAAAQGEPRWLHVSTLGGAVAASVPGDAPRPAAGLQLELSRTLPVGFGVSVGIAPGSQARGAAEPAGPWAEATFAYRFRLRFRGWIAPYAGPLLGGMLHDLDGAGAPAGNRRWLARWHFGGRAGIDVPVGRRWPALRVEAAYRHFPPTGGFGTGNLTTALIGFRWSRPFS